MKSHKIKILLFGDGNCIHICKWLNGLCMENEFEVHLLSMNPAGIRSELFSENRITSIKVISPQKINQDGGNYHYLFNIIRIAFYIQKLHPHIINAHYLTSYGFIGALLKFKSKLILSLHGTDVMVTPKQSILKKIISKYAIYRADYIFAVSKSMLSELNRINKSVQNKTTVIQYGIHKRLLEKKVNRKESIFVCNRAWVENSNIDIIIEVFKTLGMKYKLLLIGKTDDRFGNDLNELARKYSNIDILPIQKYKDNIDLISQCKYFISYTNSDGTSLSLLEAMALQCIPIVSDIPPNREWIEDDFNGFLVNLNDEEDFCKKVRKALALNENKIDEIIKFNLKNVNKNCIFEKNFTFINNLIKKNFYGTSYFCNNSGKE